jgi:hypothetical protein
LLLDDASLRFILADISPEDRWFLHYYLIDDFCTPGSRHYYADWWPQVSILHDLIHATRIFHWDDVWPVGKLISDLGMAVPIGSLPRREPYTATFLLAVYPKSLDDDPNLRGVLSMIEPGHREVLRRFLAADQSDRNAIAHRSLTEDTVDAAIISDLIGSVSMLPDEYTRIVRILEESVAEVGKD